MPLRAEGEGKGRTLLGAVGFSLMMVLKRERKIVNVQS